MAPYFVCKKKEAKALLLMPHFTLTTRGMLINRTD